MGGGWGVGGGEARGPRWRGRIRGVEGENKRGGGGNKKGGGGNKKGGGGEEEGWSRVIKFLNSPERPEQGD